MCVCHVIKGSLTYLLTYLPQDVLLIAVNACDGVHVKGLCRYRHRIATACVTYDLYGARQLWMHGWLFILHFFNSWHSCACIKPSNANYANCIQITNEGKTVQCTYTTACVWCLIVLRLLCILLHSLRKIIRPTLIFSYDLWLRWDFICCSNFSTIHCF